MSANNTPGTYGDSPEGHDEAMIADEAREAMRNSPLIEIKTLSARATVNGELPDITKHQPLRTSFTPGPWKLDLVGDGKRWIVGDGQSSWGTEVGEVYRDDTDRQEAEANARLISSAPELLAALTAYEHAWAAEKHAENTVIPADAPNGELQALFEDADRLLAKAKEAARAAIAAATGGQP